MKKVFVNISGTTINREDAKEVARLLAAKRNPDTRGFHDTTACPVLHRPAA